MAAVVAALAGFERPHPSQRGPRISSAAGGQVAAAPRSLAAERAGDGDRGQPGQGLGALEGGQLRFQIEHVLRAFERAITWTDESMVVGLSQLTRP